MEIASVIKFEGDNDVLVWKHPNEDFNTTSQLIVHESQEAILFLNGQALDLFGPGRHTLETQNIPLLNKLVNIPTDGESPFHCEVYFINKVDSMNLLWGTNAPLLIKDPVYNIILPIRANGQFAVRIEDSRKFLIRLVGTIDEFNQETMTNYFRGILLSKIKDTLSNMLINEKITFLEVNSYLLKISESMKDVLVGDFIEYGINLVNFYVGTISIPEDDPSYIRLRNALSKKTEMDVVGYNYHQERTYDILDKAAGNEGAGGSIMGAGIGLGMGVNVGGNIANSMSNTMENINPDNINCPKCKALINKNSKFCPECGNSMTEKKTCSKCHQEIEANAKFCPECGQGVGD